MNGPALSIVVPVYNSASSIRELVADLAALEISGGHEIILVNDASRDDSIDICRTLLSQIPKPITLVDLARNFGEHNAVMAGLRHAQGKHVVTMDDDFQNPPSEVLRLLEYAQSSGRDVIYGYYEIKRHSRWRNLGSSFANWCADRLLDKPKGLYLSTFRCLSAFAVKQVLLYSGPFPYVDGIILQSISSIDQVSIRHAPRLHGRSNYTFARLVRLWLDIVVNFSILPLRFITLVGVVMSISGLLGILWIVAEALLSKTPRGWACLAVTVLFFVGVQSLILGTIGEYLGRIFLTVNGKPQWVIKGVYRNDTTQTHNGDGNQSSQWRGT